MQLYSALQRYTLYSYTLYNLCNTPRLLYGCIQYVTSFFAFFAPEA